MKGIALVLALVLVAVARADNIVELTDTDFDAFIKSHSAVMVKFYSPGCTHCKAFAPEYEKAAQIVAETRRPYAFAQLDVNRHGNTADTYRIGKLPAIKLFINGLPLDYYEERMAGILIQFIDHIYKHVFVSTELKSIEDAKARVGLKEIQIILATNDKDIVETYKKVAKAYEEINFFHITENMGQQAFPDIIKMPSIVILKDFDEKRVIYSGPMSERLLDGYIADQVKPKIVEFNQQTIAQLFKPSGKKGVVLLRTPNPEGQKAEEEFKKLADRQRAADLLFIVSDIADGLGQRVGKMLNVKQGDLPHMEIVETGDRLQRNKFEGKFVFEEMNKFVKDWKDGKKPKADL